MSGSHTTSPESSKTHGSKHPSTQKGRKFMNITVYFLDDSSHVFQLQAKTLGQVLFEKVCKFLNLLEVDYFGLEYEDEKGAKCWLDVLKPLCSQIPTLFPSMYFCVKFYTPDPVQLEDEYTRYLFGLQLKKDLASGLLQCNDNTAAVIISYLVQAEIGDFIPEKYTDSSYLSSHKFVPYQEGELERKIMENHKKLIGQTPAEADMNLLETARRCELYGIKMTAAKDHEGLPLNLAVAHVGVLVFQNFTKINTFSWVKIRKLSFKRKKFLIKLHPEGYYKDTVEYFFDSRNECKNFWKKCIENHTFFRCTDAKQGMRQKPKIFSRGSSFRYSGRTQKQVSEYVRENCLKRPPFQRSTSLRTPSSPSRSTGSPITPQPLLPVTSLSCGSISDIPKEKIPAKMLSASEPTTPHVAPDINRSMNGDCSTTKEIQGALNTPTSEKSDLQQLENNNNTLSDLLMKNEENNKKSTSISDHFDNNNEYGTKSNGIKDSISEYCASIKVQADIEPIPNHKNEPRSIDSLNRLSGGYKSVEGPKFDDQSSITDDLSYQSPNEENFNLINELQQSYGSSTFYVSSPLISRSKKTPTDKAYCLAKEMLMTERTYRKDLEIVNVVFREEFYKQFSMQCFAVEEMLKFINPLYEKHCFLLRDLEQRLAFWEGRPLTRGQSGAKGIGDVLLNNKEMIQNHQEYLKNLPYILKLVQNELICDDSLATFYQQFESNKFCYLPLTSFLLRPAFRLPYYYSLLKNILSCYNPQHVDYEYCVEALEVLKSFCESFEERIKPVINYVKLMELQRSLIGFPNLLNEEREFVREGCLLKFSRNGSHQHMFFLFSDIILYTTRIHNSNFRFKVQGQIPTCDLKIEDTEPKHGVKHCFSLSRGEKHLVVSASSDKELLKWMEDFKKTVYSTENGQLNSSNSSSQMSRSFSEDSYESSDDADDLNFIRDEKPISHHSNTSVHICWHRNISISSSDLLISLKHSISGYLLRKFKNNSGWQKLWVVLANLCLFFYKSYSDESPLASLPLAGYRISTTTNSDIVCGECIFKLRFKSHKYFFMVENKHTFDRWMEAINFCTLAEEENTHL